MEQVMETSNMEWVKENGKYLYITRCRDCGRSREDGYKCTRWATGHWDESAEVDVIELADVKPDGFCFCAVRKEVA